MLIAILSLTVTQLPFTAMESTCSGGIAGRVQKVRLTPDGRMTRSDALGKPLVFAGRMTAAEAKALSGRLDHITFDTMPSLPRAHTVYDGVSCTLTREGKVWHRVQFVAGAAAPSPASVERYREARAVMATLLAAADRVMLNPQPIPPEPDHVAPPRVPSSPRMPTPG